MPLQTALALNAVVRAACKITESAYAATETRVLHQSSVRRASLGSLTLLIQIRTADSVPGLAIRTTSSRRETGGGDDNRSDHSACSEADPQLAQVTGTWP